MSASRIQLFSAVGLVVTVGLAGSTAAASGPSGASASEAWRGVIGIRCKGNVGISGPQSQRRFTLSVVRSQNGARWRVISDRGRWVDREVGPPSPRFVRTLAGAKGTIWITTGPVSRERWAWRITKGTKAYAGLRGHGTATIHRNLGFVDITMKGTVSR